MAIHSRLNTLVLADDQPMNGVLISVKPDKRWDPFNPPYLYVKAPVQTSILFFTDSSEETVGFTGAYQVDVREWNGDDMTYLNTTWYAEVGDTGIIHSQLPSIIPSSSFALTCFGGGGANGSAWLVL